MERDKVHLLKQYLSDLTDADWEDLIGTDDLQGPRRRSRRRTSETRNLVDYSTTKWGMLLSCKDLQDSTSLKARLFRRRFRMPFNLFSYILTRCREKAIFSSVGSKHSQIPDEIKLMLCLRVLGRDNLFDDISEMSDMGESTALTVFTKFVLSFSFLFQEEFIKIPEGDDFITLWMITTSNHHRINHYFLVKTHSISKNSKSRFHNTKQTLDVFSNRL